MTSTIRVTLAALIVPALALSMLTYTATSTAASTPTPAVGIPFNYWVDATTTLAKLDQTVTIPRGTFKGTIDLATFALSGSIKLPPAVAPVSIAGLPALAMATFKVHEVEPVTGLIDVAAQVATATSVFDIKIVSLTPAGLPFINLVGDSCKTSKPVSVTMSGPLTAPLTFSGTYTIPPLKNCGAATTALNLVVPGPGNTFTAVATQR